MTHNLNCTVFVYRHRETGAIRALYTKDARAMTGRDDYEHVASLEPRMWIEYHFDDAAKERQPLTDEQRYALIKEHLGLDKRRDETVIDHRTGRWHDGAPGYTVQSGEVGAWFKVDVSPSRAAELDAELARVLIAKNLDVEPFFVSFVGTAQ